VCVFKYLGVITFFMGACWKMVVVHGRKDKDGGSLWGEKVITPNIYDQSLNL